MTTPMSTIDSWRPKVLDVLMLTITGGRERTRTGSSSSRKPRVRARGDPFRRASDRRGEGRLNGGELRRRDPLSCARSAAGAVGHLELVEDPRRSSDGLEESPRLRASGRCSSRWRASSTCARSVRPQDQNPARLSVRKGRARGVRPQPEDRSSWRPCGARAISCRQHL
jgi:hypothetical protein